jgi:hypothetical protein
MPQCQFPVFCYFCVSKKLHGKYSQNWTKQKPKFLFLPARDGVQSRDGGEPGASHTIGWRGPAPCRATRWWGHLAHLLMPLFHLYICGDPAYHCMSSMQVVDITPMKYHLTSITSIRVVQQKHRRSKVGA